MFETRDINQKLRAKKIIYIVTICLILLFLLFIVLLYIVVPIIFMFSITVQEALMFTRFNLPRSTEYFNESFPDLKNFYVDVKDIDSNKTITLGVWHLLPWIIWDEFGNSTTPINYDALLANSSFGVILHFHGTGETRRDSYNMFSLLRIFFHVIAFDYRKTIQTINMITIFETQPEKIQLNFSCSDEIQKKLPDVAGGTSLPLQSSQIYYGFEPDSPSVSISYGDSSDGIMTEEAVVSDCKELYKWLLKKTNAKIYVWGHSLGASLALRSMAELSEENIIPTAVILEAAFTTMREEIPVHPYGQIFAWLPWLDATILNPLEENGFRFNNSKHIVEIPCPIMAFHAEDDSVIPLHLGQKLNNIAVAERNKTMGEVVFHQVSAEYGCDHFWLYIYPGLVSDIENFLNTI